MFRRTAVSVALSLACAALGCSGTNTSSSDAGGNGGAAGSAAGGGSGGVPSSNAGSGGLAPFDPGVAGSAQLGSLSDSDTQKLCDELQQYVSGAPFMQAEGQLSCGAAGIAAAFMATDMTDSGIQSACKSASDACTAALKDTNPMMTDTCDKPDASCTATVAEYTACLNDAVNVLNTTNIPACSTLTKANLQTALLSLAGLAQGEPASCTAYEMKCPGGTGMPDPGAM